MTGRNLTAAIALAFAAALGGGTAFAEGDAAKGKKVFKKCKTCHTFDPGKKKIGPHLKGIVLALGILLQAGEGHLVALDKGLRLLEVGVQGLL